MSRPRRAGSGARSTGSRGSWRAWTTARSACPVDRSSRRPVVRAALEHVVQRRAVREVPSQRAGVAGLLSRLSGLGRAIVPTTGTAGSGAGGKAISRSATACTAARTTRVGEPRRVSSVPRAGSSGSTNPGARSISPTPTAFFQQLFFSNMGCQRPVRRAATLIPRWVPSISGWLSPVGWRQVRLFEVAPDSELIKRVLWSPTRVLFRFIAIEIELDHSAIYGCSYL